MHTYKNLFLPYQFAFLNERLITILSSECNFSLRGAQSEEWILDDHDGDNYSQLPQHLGSLFTEHGLSKYFFDAKLDLNFAAIIYGIHYVSFVQPS